MQKNKTIFITGTDTGVGKTVASVVLGMLLQGRGLNVGIMKPVQCAGDDAQFLKRVLKIKDDIRLINPFFAPEGLSPHLAFRRSRIKFDKRRIQEGLKALQTRHDIVLVEGAGGLMVPLNDEYTTADMIVDLKVPVIIVARLGLGTINHSLLTINEAKRRKLNILGLIFCQTKPGRKSLPETTNPQEIEKLSGVKVLGIIPYLKSLEPADILRQCQNHKLNV